MAKLTPSPLAPVKFPNLPALAGIKLVTAATGLKYKGRDDLFLMLADDGTSFAGVFTKSATAAAPVHVSRAGLKSGMARAVLTNAVYFKAPWASKFKAEATHDREFNVLGGSSIPVPTMSQTTAIKYTEGEGYQAAQLPFRNGELAMVFILPDAGQLAEFEADLTAETLGEIATNLESVRAHIQIPKFEFETTTLLKDPLQTLGLRKIFSGGDLTGMSEQGNLSVSGVFHKTFIAVEEGGAEAAAATAIVIDRTSVEPDPEVIFKADRPFLFGIQDIETGLFLFFGRVVDPR